ncbi:MAG: YybS family protein [Desulfocapsa sp.]|nr:YybS family protein [Desulfocapsa sp.]
MSQEEKDISGNVRHIQQILLVAAVILFPGLLGALFGWIHGLLPLLVFYYLRRYGRNEGKKYILYGCLLAFGASLVFQIVEQLLFSLTLLPTGFVLAASVDNDEPTHIAGVKGAAALAGSWILATTILSFGMEHHPYTLLINSMNQGMDEAVSYYTKNSSVPPETIVLLEQAFSQIKIWLPKLMPGILTCTTLLVTWFSMVAGNWLLYKKTGNRPWPEYRFWTLPERLVWAVIISVILVLLPMEPGRTIGMNILLVTGLLYCFQGIAIMLFFFYKWSVPVFLRTLIYVILFFQSFGVIFLAILGVADVWADMRRLDSTEQDTDV